MKNLKTMSKKTLGGLCVIFAISALLSSCLKKDNVQVSPPTALVDFIQASPDQPSIDLYLDNNKVNINPLKYGDNLTYFNVYAGNRSAKVTNDATQAKILSDSLHFLPNNAYSVFLTNTTANPQFVTLNDSISRPATGNGAIRFVNLSPDAPAVDFALTGGAVLAPGISFKNHSAFLPEPSGKTYNLEVRQAGTNTVLATLANVNVNEAFIYTIYLRGLVAGTTTANKLSISSVVNAYY